MVNINTMTEEQRGNLVAKEVWIWLHKQKAIKFVPWVLNLKSEAYDPTKVAVQAEREQLLADLESIIMDVVKRTK
jgi:hypothetical protein